MQKIGHVCVTPLIIPDSLNKSREIGSFLSGNWTLEAEKMLLKQKFQIARLNATRITPVTYGEFPSWLTSAFSFFKEWVWVGLFAVCSFLGIALCLWLVCRICIRAHREKVLLTQALLAIDSGASPQAWISTLVNSK